MTRNLTETQVRRRFTKMRKASGLSFDKFGDMHGLSGEFVRNVEQGKRPPSKAILRILGLERVIAYRIAPSTESQPTEAKP